MGAIAINQPINSCIAQIIHSLLLQIILSAGLGVTAWKWTSERLDTGVYPLVPLKMTPRRETPPTYVTQVGLRLPLSWTCSTVLSLAGRRWRCHLSSGVGMLWRYRLYRCGSRRGGIRDRGCGIEDIYFIFDKEVTIREVRSR